MADKLTLERWNSLIEQVNELADECDLEHLDQVTAPHKWSKSDVQQMQDKLRDICDDNEFSDVPEKWKQSIIDEFEEAIAAGACCCEDQTIEFVPPFVALADDVSQYNFDTGNGTKIQSEVRDWGAFLKEQAVGPQYSSWQVFLGNQLGYFLVASGTIVEDEENEDVGVFVPEVTRSPYALEESPGPSGDQHPEGGEYTLSDVDGNLIETTGNQLAGEGGIPTPFEGLASIQVGSRNFSGGSLVDFERFDPIPPARLVLLCD